MNKQIFSFPAEQAQTLTQRWVEVMVVGLNLCPFAAPEVKNNAIRYAVSHAESLPLALEGFLSELDRIQSAEEAELSTTLLAFTQLADDFDDFLELLDYCQQLLEESGLDGVFQLASFHPAYCFEGVEERDITNWTNRAPFPTIHIIREGQMSRVLTHYRSPEEIPERNMQLMESLGREGLIERFPEFEKYCPA